LFHSRIITSLAPTLPSQGTPKKNQKELTMTIYLRYLSINEAAGVLKLSQSKKKKEKKTLG
jgi:hypothetical protein